MWTSVWGQFLFRQFCCNYLLLTKILTMSRQVEAETWCNHQSDKKNTLILKTVAPIKVGFYEINTFQDKKKQYFWCSCLEKKKLISIYKIKGRLITPKSIHIIQGYGNPLIRLFQPWMMTKGGWSHHRGRCSHRRWLLVLSEASCAITRYPYYWPYQPYLVYLPLLAILAIIQYPPPWS